MFAKFARGFALGLVLWAVGYTTLSYPALSIVLWTVASGMLWVVVWRERRRPKNITVFSQASHVKYPAQYGLGNEEDFE